MLFKVSRGPSVFSVLFFRQEAFVLFLERRAAALNCTICRKEDVKLQCTLSRGDLLYYIYRTILKR